MPGIAGHLAQLDTVRIQTLDERFTSMLKSLKHFSWLDTRAIISSPQLRVGTVSRQHVDGDVDVWQHELSGKEVVLHGSAMDPLSRVKLSAREFLDRCEAATFDVGELDGSFVAAIWDPQTAHLRLINDRLGSLPVYYAMNRGRFFFAPEANAIVVGMGSIPDFDQAGVASFLTNGYCLGTDTLFEAIKVLQPGSVLSLDVREWELRETHYWTLRYQADRSLMQPVDAEAALWESLVDSMSCLASDESERKAVMLSGGWDSRAMLPLMRAAKGKFEYAKSWGHLSDVPYSDVSLARQLAAMFGLPFDFVQYGTDEFIDNAAQWCSISGLVNDNIGWYSEGVTTLSEGYDKAIDSLFVGDEIWGWGTDVASDREIRAAILPPELPGSVSGMLQSAYASECRDAYLQSIEQSFRRCDQDAPNDRKDFFYLYARVARFIFSVGYYKEHSTPLRRPFLGKRVLDVIQSLPAKHRVFKNLYRSMLKRYAPEVGNVAIASVDSLPDWEFDLRRKQGLKEYFAAMLSPDRMHAGPCSEMFDVAAIQASLSKELAKPIKPLYRRRSRCKGAIGEVVRSTPVGRYLNKKLRRNVVRNSESCEFRVLRRVALLNLYCENLMTQPATV